MLNQNFDSKLSLAFQTDEIKKEFLNYRDIKTDKYPPHGVNISMGLDGISYETFDADLTAKCKIISQRVLSGKYQFYPLREVEVPKGESKIRVLSISRIQDTLVQKILYRVLAEELERLLFARNRNISAVSFGYRKGKSATGAVRHVYNLVRQGFNFALDADIIRFFDEISHARLVQLIHTHIDSKLARDLLKRFIKTDGQKLIGNSHKSKPLRKSRSQGIPQGGVLSGLLANLYLYEFDCWILETLSRSYNIKYIRYADDFILLTTDESSLQGIHSLVHKKLIDIDLQMHPLGQKTRYVNISDEPLVFLGFNIDLHEIKISCQNLNKFKKRIKQKINQEQTYNFPANPATRFEYFIQKIVNRKIQGYTSEMCSVCGKPITTEVRSWVHFFSIITTPTQLHDLDKWIRSQIGSHFYRRYSFSVSRKDFRKAGLLSLEQEYYRLKNFKTCSCPPLSTALP